MIITTLRIVLPPEKKKESMQILRFLNEPIQVKPGCISCRIYQDVKNPNAFALVEEWESKEDLDKHIISDEYTMILALMDISSAPPEIKFNTIADFSGLETVEAARKPVRTRH